ncbi:MAG TPA: DUF4230 domain-containing protein [Thermoanaerobaculia bacterium]
MLAGVIVITTAGVYVAWRMTRQAMESVVDRALTPKEQTIDLSALVTQVRSLSRLETASMRVLHISTITQSYELVPDAIAGDKMSFLAAGDVIAGVDLSLLNRNDVWKQPDGTIVMRLPRSQILVTRVDNRESRVLNRKTGLFRRADVNLESRARQHAEQEIRNEALRKGILNMASQNAQTKLAEFLHTLGFQKVQFVQEKQVIGRGS